MTDNKKAIDKNYLLTQFKNFDSGLLSKKYSSKEETAEIEKAVFADANVFETESTNDFSIFNNNYGPSNVYWQYNNTSIKVGDVLVIKKDLTLSGTYTDYHGTSYSTTVTLPKGNYRYLKKFVEGGGAISGIFVANTTTSFFDPSSSNYGKYWQTFESKNISKLDEFEAEVDKEFNLIRNNLICPNVTTTQGAGGGMGLSFILPNVSRSDVKVGDIVYVSKEISVSFSEKTGTFKKGFYKCTSIYYDIYNGGSWWIIFDDNGPVNNEYLGATLTDSILSTMLSDLYGATSIAIGTSTTALNNSSGFGESCYADKWAHAQGYKTTAINVGAHAEGSRTYATSYISSTSNDSMGQGAHAEGYKTSAMCGSVGYGIHAEGHSTYASDIGGYYGGEHAEGYYTSSYGGHYGGGTHAEGDSTRAYNGGHAEGYYTSCGTSDSSTGAFCHVEGYYTSASSNIHGQHVSGKYNKGNSSNILEVGNGSSNTSRSNAFTVTYAGEVKAASTITGSATADYAEYFEWRDGNPNNEDRICKFVTLDGNKITTATSNEDYILGVVSVEPFVLGNADIDNWNGMYVRDKFGRIVYEDRQLTYLNVETGEEEISYDADGNPVIEKIPIINPDFDPDREYVGRADRPEWSPVGMLGQLLVYQDGTAEVNKYVCCNEEGIATACDRKTENAYRVIEVIDDELVRIIFK